MSKSEEQKQRVYRAIHGPLSEYFDAYIIVGYTAGTQDRLVMVNAPSKIARDGLRPVEKTAGEWVHPIEEDGE